MRVADSLLALLTLPFIGACGAATESGPGIERFFDGTAERVEVRADRRDGWRVPASSHRDARVELRTGDLIRFAVGAPSLAAGPARKVGFRVSWLRAGDDPAGLAEQRLDQVLRTTGAPWQEREVLVTEEIAGAGTLRFATWADATTPAAFADARILRSGFRAVRRPPNLVVYVVDTLRADHLSCYGARNPTSPRVDALAADGFLFEAFRAVAPWTRPTTATLLTGYHPTWHGMGRELPLPASLETLAETLSAAGYSTWGAVANPQVGEVALGFEQGFDRFVTHRGIGRDLRGEERIATSTRLGEVVGPWLEAAADEPFFLYVHSLDPHTPYAPPDELGQRFAVDYDGPLADKLLFTKELEALGADVTAADLRFIENAYDDEVRHNDLEIGRLLDALERQGVLAETVVVVVSDHGEEFQEHGGWNHGYRMYEELLHVPFVLWLPPELRAERGLAPRRIAKPVSQVDFLPGLLEVLGVRDRFPRQGRSWAPLLAGDEADLTPFVAVDYQAHQGDEIGAFSDGRYKLIWNTDARLGTLSEELFDLEADPRERNDLAQQLPDVVVRLRSERAALLDDTRRVRQRLDAAGLDDVLPYSEEDTAPVVLDEEALQELEAIGYGGE